MAIPVIYNVRSARERWMSSVVAVVGIAGTVGVFVAMLALARGFKATLVSSGLPQNAVVLRGGSGSEMGSILTIEEVRIVEDAPQVARVDGAALVSPEVVVIAAIPMRATGTDANVQVRGVTPRVLDVRDNVKIVEGRFIRPGVAEAVIGKGARDAYAGLEVGKTVALGAGIWTIVGMFDSRGSAFDSEVWADASVLNGNYNRPANLYQSVTARLASIDDFDAFKATVESNPRTTVEAQREQEYYASKSQIVTTLITVLGSLMQTFSHLAFAFRVTPHLLVMGMAFALVLGAVGGLPPAIRAARANVAHTLRAL